MEKSSRFSLGHLVATPAALLALERNQQTPLESLARHAHGDWGDVSADDRALNDDAVMHRGRLFSVYRLHDNEKIWIITEADRSFTTILLPEDY